MKNALICTPNETIRSGLLTGLMQAEFRVSHVDEQGDIFKAVKQDEYDLLISEVHKCNFASLMKAIINANPSIKIYLMDNGSIFCFYPFCRQSIKFINTIKNAGVKISDQLLKHTNPDMPTLGDVVMLS
jgi:thioredoxin-related protein